MTNPAPTTSPSKLGLKDVMAAKRAALQRLKDLKDQLYTGDSSGTLDGLKLIVEKLGKEHESVVMLGHLANQTRGTFTDRQL